MTKLTHPKSRAERLRIKAKKDKREKVDRALAVKRRIEQEALEQKEVLNEFRRKVYATEEGSDY